jgi:transcriptional regulator with XRE-family HTH domain
MSVSVPERAGPHVKLVFAEMQRQGWTYDRMEDKSGVKRPALKGWRTKNYPSLQNLEAVLSVLGWDLIPVPRDRVIDADILAELQPIAGRLGVSLDDAVQFASEIAVSRHSKSNLPA